MSWTTMISMALTGRLLLDEVLLVWPWSFIVIVNVIVVLLLSMILNPPFCIAV